MKIKVEVENIRCGGCASTITKKLMEINEVESVDIAIEDQIVTVETANEAVKEEVVTTLLKLGYPEKGSVEGLEAIKGKAKSVVSCAVGKIG